MLLIFGIPVLAANWVQINQHIYIDNNSIQQQYNPQIYSYWMKGYNDNSELWQKIEHLYNKRASHSLAQNIIDCNNRKEFTTHAYIYDIKGNAITSYANNNTDWKPIPPETTSDKIYNYICTIPQSNTKNIQDYLQDGQNYCDKAQNSSEYEKPNSPFTCIIGYIYDNANEIIKKQLENIERSCENETPYYKYKECIYDGINMQ